MYTEFRVRTVCELTLNEEYYLQPSIVSFCSHSNTLHKNVLLATSSNFHQATDICADKPFLDSLRVCFQLDCCDATKSGTYSNLWHMYGLASVLKQPIASVYPEVNPGLRPLYHKTLSPRRIADIKCSLPYVIMWTRALSSIPLGILWQPNHFVPCIPSNYKCPTICASVVEKPRFDSKKDVSLSNVRESVTCIEMEKILGVHLSHSQGSKHVKFRSSTSIGLKAYFSPVSNDNNLSKKTDYPLTMSSARQSSSPTPSQANTALASVQSSSLGGIYLAHARSQSSTETAYSLVCSESTPSSQPDSVLVSPSFQVEPPLANVCGHSLDHKGNLPASAQPSSKSYSAKNPAISQESSHHIPYRQGVCPLPNAHLSSLDRTDSVLGSATNTATISQILFQDHSQVRGQAHSLGKTDNLLSSNLSPSEADSVLTSTNFSSSQTCSPMTSILSSSQADMQLTADSTRYDLNRHCADTNSCLQGSNHSHSNDVKTDCSAIGGDIETRKILGVHLALNHGKVHNHNAAQPNVSSTKGLKAYFKRTIEPQQRSYEDTGVSTFSQTDRHDTISQSSSLLSSGYSNMDSIEATTTSGNESVDYWANVDSSSDIEMDFSQNMDPSTDEWSSQDSDSSSCQIMDELAHPLPFPNVSVEWYRRQHTLSMKNASRDILQQPCCSEYGVIQYINRSRVDGTLQENIHALEKKVEVAKDTSNKAQLLSLVKVGQFVLTSGLLVKTQDVAMVYGDSTRKNRPSAELYNIFSKHLNLVQVYIHGVAYLLYSPPGSNILRLLDTLRSLHLPDDVVINNRAKERLKDTYATALEYMDTHRDRQVLKAVMASITSTKFAATLEGVSSRQGTSNARRNVATALGRYNEIKETSQIVRTDLTNEQQYQLTRRIVSARKMKEIKSIAEGRGRKLKIEHFPQLSIALEYAFGELDMSEGGGGGLESHPRLTTGTLYRSVDNVTTMKRAREILLSLSPQGFTISLSSCYNYTNNYRRGSLQAKRHHAEKLVNADLSLKKPPRIGVPQIVVNLHWTTANVNLMVDSTLSLSHCVVMSKDAKSIVLADSSPVQLPGHSWRKKLVLPDHSWDQSRTNAVTPMTYLFLQPIVSTLPYSQLESLDIHVSQSTVLQVTRSGQGVTLLNLSFFEPDNTFKCLNEVFLLLSIFALDPFFRDRLTGKLKKEFTFVVDNGPAEQPNCPLVKMCLVRLLLFLDLHKITQVSFAEYHSKRNFVERVHAEENRVLSKHGPFSSTYVHKNATVGSVEHRDNMEEMAKRIQGCISSGTFGGQQLHCYRGIKPEDYICNDERCVTRFLSLTEDSKLEYTPAMYETQQNKLLQDIHYMWNTPLAFSGNYIQDHQLIHNELIEQRTAWAGKYVSVFYSPSDDITCKRYELQPLPDFIRWIKTGELHYLPFEEASAINCGPWTEIPDAFLPTKVLDLCFNIIHDPPDDILKQIALLAWIPPHEVKEYQIKLEEQLKSQISLELEKVRWKETPIYHDNTKSQLEVMCRQAGIPVTPAMPKHQLCSLLIQKQGESEPPVLFQPLYSGKLSSIPHTPSGISHLTVAKLKTILKAHNLPYLGSKDELVLRVIMLRHGRTKEAALKEKGQLKDLVKLAKELIMKQQSFHLTEHIYRVRKYGTHTSKTFVPMPSHITGNDDLSNLYNPLLDYIQHLKHDFTPSCSKPASLATPTGDDSSSSMKEQVSQTGAIIEVKWNASEVRGSGWKPGWYRAEVQGYCDDTDIVTLRYVSEPNECYEEELEQLLQQKKIKLLQSPL